MGLCKCPKRRVTNQFCFEHHANVCEHCMVTNHKKCIVQSYLQWLQDSDYNPVCELCSKDLGAEDCVRLTCYHVFHWWCLDTWARNLPPDTAPAGFTCPSCHSALFPAANLVSPVADVLKEKLAGVNWARTGLGLPLLSEEVSQPINRSVSQSSALPNNIPISSPAPPPAHSVIHVPDNTFARVEGSGPRRTTSHDHHTSGSETSTLLFDHDEDKYKRRSPSEWVLRRWKSIWSSGRSRRHWRPVVAIFAVVIFILLLMAALGRNNQNSDSDFDFQNNPHIRNNDA